MLLNNIKSVDLKVGSQHVNMHFRRWQGLCNFFRVYESNHVDEMTQRLKTSYVDIQKCMIYNLTLVTNITERSSEHLNSKSVYRCFYLPDERII